MAANHMVHWRRNICITRFIHMCDMPLSYVRHESFASVTRLIHMNMASWTRRDVWQDRLLALSATSVL